MDDLVQKRDPATSNYERPFRKWKCAGGINGKPCSRGPSCEGVCGATSACEPIKREDRWYCTRDILSGGPCQDGPLPDGQCACQETPCIPELSARAIRRRSIWWAILLMLGVVTSGVGGAWTWRFINPGTVADHHVTIEQCDVCHSETMNHGFAHWMAAFFDEANVVMENQRCTNCHELGTSPQTAHGFTLAELVLKTTRAQEKMTAEKVSPPLFKEDNVACATCHKEHQMGEKINRKSCNSCHVDNSNAFPGAHPPFESFPYERRTALIFDHSSHFNQHFDKEAERAPELCLDCHYADSEGRRMEVKSYQLTCQVCHDKQITGDDRATGPKGIPFFVLPGIDVETLAVSNIHIGQWPLFAEGKITPLMQDLLLEQPFHMLDSIDLMDLQVVDETTRQKTSELAWAIKTFLYDLSVNGPEAVLKTRLENQLGRQATQTELSALAASLPVAVLQDAVHDWFPNLADEVQAYREGRTVFSAAYDPSEDIDSVSEEVLQDFVETVSDDSNNILGDDEGDLLSEDDSGILGNDEGNLLSEDDSEILGNDEGDLLSEDDSGILGGDEGDLLSEDSSGILGDDEDELLSEDNSEIPSDNETITISSAPEVTTEQWNKLGGWYYTDFSVLYRPARHSDQVLKELITLSGQLSHKAFLQLTDDKAQGQCAKCHARSEAGDGSLQLEWLQMVSTMTPQQLTVFRHAPHFATQTSEGCRTCHVIGNNSKAYQDSFQQTDTSHFKSNFEPMTIEQCDTCHNEQTQLNECITCHQYHPGGVDVRPLRSHLVSTDP